MRERVIECVILDEYQCAEAVADLRRSMSCYESKAVAREANFRPYEGGRRSHEGSDVSER